MRKSSPVLQFSAGAFQFLGDELFIGKDGLILGGEHFVGEIVECVMGLGGSFFGAENEADGRVFAGFHPVLAGVVEVEVHLASVGVAELANLQVHDYKHVANGDGRKRGRCETMCRRCEAGAGDQERQNRRPIPRGNR